MTDNIFTSHGLWGWVEDSVGLDRVSGGDNILIPIGTAEDANGGSYSGYDVFDTDPSETLTNAVYTWKSYQQPIVAQAREVLRNNRTPEGVINMWLAKSDVALKSLRSKLNTAAFADGTGNAGKDILGLEILVDSAGTVGGINRATDAFWQANETAVGGALTLALMITKFNDCTTGSNDGMGVPDMIVTDQDEYEAYETLLTAGIRYTPAQAGGTSINGQFTGLSFKGVPLMFDADATATNMYFLNSATFEAWIHPDRDFLTTEIARADNGTLMQDAWIANLLVWPEFAIAEPRRNGKLTGLTD